MNNMREYLANSVELRRAMNEANGQKRVWPYVCQEDYVLANGRGYESQELTRDERAYVLEVARRYGRRLPIRQCFSNSQSLLAYADYEKRLTYVEGFAFRYIPVLHGWLDLNGKVIDTTMRHKRRGSGALRDRVLGSWTDERLYHGVRMDRDYVLRKIIERGFVGTLIDDWWAGWPLLTGDVVAHVVGDAAA